MTGWQRTAIGIEATACVTATAAAAGLYSNFFHDSGYILPLLISAASGASAGLIAARRRSLPLMIMLAIVGFLVVAAGLLYRSTTVAGFPTPRTVGVIVDDLGQGWGRMLSVALPADATAALLIVPLFGCWLAAFTAVVVARRSTAPLAPAAPLLALFVLGLLITAGHPESQLGVTAVFLTAVAILVLIRAGRAGGAVTSVAAKPPIAVSQSATGVPSVVIVVLLSMIGASVLQQIMGPRFDPRSIDPPPVRIADTLNPLAMIKSQLRTMPPEKLLTVRVSADDPAFDRVRLAVLDRYDGRTWTTETRFLVAGHMLSRPAPVLKTRPITVGITLEKRTGPFLPTVGQPVMLDGTDMGGGRIGFDEHSGTLVTDAPLPRNLSYQLTAMVAARNPSLAMAQPASTGTDGSEASLPAGVPGELLDASARITGSAQTPHGKLLAIEAYLRQLPYSLDAPPGHSWHLLSRLVTGKTSADQRGYAEQHAAAFAVLARAQHLPTRISVGYLLRTKQDGVFTVTTADAHAWPEVYFPDYGWISFEPTNSRQSRPDVPTGVVPPLVAEQKMPPPNVAPPLVEPANGPKPATGNGFADIIMVALVISVGLVCLGVLATVTCKLWRRHRRRQAGIKGAWREAIDRLVEQGFTPPPSATPLELAGLAAAEVGRRSVALATLAPLSDLATFSRHPPDPASVEWAWLLERQLATTLTAGRLRRLRQLRALADPRPLWSSLIIRRARRRAFHQLGVDQL
jgi:hypothetical protein